MKDIVPVKLCLVKKMAQEEIWVRLVRSYHYLGYKIMYGPRIKYLVMYCNQPLAALSFKRATLRVGVCESYIGWDDLLKSKHLDRLVSLQTPLATLSCRRCNVNICVPPI